MAQVAVIEKFLPEQLTEEEIEKVVVQTIDSVGASGMQDMGKVMNELKPQVLGRVDMGHLSKKVRAALAG